MTCAVGCKFGSDGDMKPEDNLPRNLQPSDPDRTMPCHGGKLTQTDSVSSTVSSSVVPFSKEFFSQHPDAGRPGKITGWTDARHDSYLDFLEERFVKQLHQSMHKSPGQSENQGPGPYSASHVSKNTPEDGSQQKINSDRDKLLVNSKARFDVPMGSTGMHQFASAVVQYSMASDSKEHGVSSSQSTHPQEISGQNFLEEDLNAKSSGVYPAKRTRKAVVDSSCSDQALPSGTYHTPNVSMSNTAFTESKKSQKEDLFSEQPEGSVYKKSDSHYVRRGI